MKEGGRQWAGPVLEQSTNRVVRSKSVRILVVPYSGDVVRKATDRYITLRDTEHLGKCR